MSSVRHSSCLRIAALASPDFPADQPATFSYYTGKLIVIIE
jgi:hypothetical protein